MINPPRSLFPAQDPRAWFRLLMDAARSHLKGGEHEAARECAERACELTNDPGSEGDPLPSASVEVIAAFSLLAEVHEAAERHAEAREILLDCSRRELLAGNEIGAAAFENRIGSLYRKDADLAEAREHLLRSLQLSSRHEPGPVRAQALEELGPVERRLGLSTDALDHLTEALRIRESLSDRARVAVGHDRIGNIHVHLGQLDAAEHHYSKSLRIYEGLEDRNGMAIVSNNLGTLQLQRGDYEAALVSFGRARDLAEEVGDGRALAWSTGNLGLAHAYLGNTSEAEPALLASIRALADRGDRAGQAIYANNLALVYLTCARYEESIAWGERSAAQMSELGNVEGATKPWLNVARANLELGRIAEAERAAEEVRRLTRSLESLEIKSEELILEASLALARSEPRRARELAAAGIEHATNGNLPRQKAEGLRLLGGAHFLEGDLERSREALSESESLFVQLGDVYDLALVRVELGRLFLRVEAFDAAARRLRQAQEVFARLGHAPLLCRSRISLAQVEAARGGGDVDLYFEGAREAAELAARSDLLAEVEAARRQIVERPFSMRDDDGVGGELAGRDRALLLELISGLRELGLGGTYLSLLGARLGLDAAVLVLEQEESMSWSWGESESLSESVRARILAGSGSGQAESRFGGASGESRFGLRAGAQTGSPERVTLPDRELFFVGIPSPGAPSVGDGPLDPVTVDTGDLADSGLAIRGMLGLSRPRADSPEEGTGCHREPPTGTTSTGGRVGVSFDLLLPLLAEVLALVSPRLEVTPIAVQQSAPFEGIIGESTEMRAIFGAIERVAPSDASVLVLGESGTGKELVARAIHERSGRKGKPFVAISCPSIPRELIEAELFGHEKGAFTGAAVERRGQIEAADGGTLFLDEIGDMDLATQTKLLRFLQEREFLRVGGRAPIRVDIRVLAATSRDLEAEIAAGRFRLDLYYRIGVVPLRIPPLRERIQDVPPLVGHFLYMIGRGATPPSVDRAVFDALTNYTWPGNVRELRNVIEYVLAMRGKEGPITTSDLPARLRDAVSPADGALSLSLRRGETLEARLLSVEGAILRRTLESCAWNQTRAARRLGLKESTMRYKMRRFDLKKPGERKATSRKRAARRNSGATRSDWAH